MKLIRNNKGQALVEFALIIPLLLMILLGIMEFSMILSDQMIIESAAREGARYAVLGATDTEIVNYILDLTETLNGNPPSVGISPVASSRVKGVQVTIKVTYNHTLVTPIIGNLVGNVLKLSASVTMRME